MPLSVRLNMTNLRTSSESQTRFLATEETQEETLHTDLGCVILSVCLFVFKKHTQ
jgi:hypothetical protein